MAYTVANLIADAYYISGIVSREFETVSGPQGELGLQVLNDVISDKTIEMDMIPYYNKYNFSTIAGVETYFVPNLESVETLVFFLNGVRYQMVEVDRVAFQGAARAKISSLPFNWNQERCLNGTNIRLYFFPNQVYQMELWGLFRLALVTMFQDLSASTTTVGLGTCAVTGAGALTGGQFIVNGIDLAGNYANANALVAYINTGVVAGVSASIVSGNFTLTSTTLPTISLATAGTEDPANCVTFANFSTLAGPINETFNATGLDQFYTSYLKFSLADRLCTEYNYVVPVGVVKQLEQYQRWISKRSGGMDLTTQKISTLQGVSMLNYAMVNLSNGFTI